MNLWLDCQTSTKAAKRLKMAKKVIEGHGRQIDKLLSVRKLLNRCELEILQ